MSAHIQVNTYTYLFHKNEMVLYRNHLFSLKCLSWMCYAIYLQFHGALIHHVSKHVLMAAKCSVVCTFQFFLFNRGLII